MIRVGATAVVVRADVGILAGAPPVVVLKGWEHDKL